MFLFRPFSQRQANLGLTLLRAITGLVFTAHGGQKLFVYGFAGVSGAFAQMGIPLPGLLGPFVALVEFFGGLALIIGLLTRLASLGLAVTMVVAIFTVHLKAGFFAPAGFEYPLTLLSTTLTLVIAGAGAWSVDALIARRFETRRENSLTNPARPTRIAA